VRAWARKNGYEVADRGRLPVEITEAYTAEMGGSAAATGRGAAKAPAKRAPAPTAAVGPAKKAPAATSAKTAPAQTVPAPARSGQPASSPPSGPGPKPSLVADDRRLVALSEQLASLTQRVAKLEATGGGKDKDKPSRFRRRS
jgi:hypothetical protein